jgi:hypothetical protein
MLNENDIPLTVGNNWLPGADVPIAKLEVDSRGVAHQGMAKSASINGVFTLKKVGTTDVPAVAKEREWWQIDVPMWRQIDVPAGTELMLFGSFRAEMPTGRYSTSYNRPGETKVTTYYDVYSGEVAFVCPALTAGKTYVLTCDWPSLDKKNKMKVTNRRHYNLRSPPGGEVFLNIIGGMFVVGLPDIMIEVLQPKTIKSAAPEEGPSLLLYERTDKGKNKNKISLKLVYQYLILEERGIPVP